MLQLIQIGGALAVLAAFAFAQFGVLGHQAWSYGGLNLLGAAVLAVLAYVEHQWGFLLLEAAWAVVSAWGLIARARRPMPRAAGSPEAR